MKNAIVLAIIALFTLGMVACSTNTTTGKKEFNKERAASFARAALIIWEHENPDESRKARLCYDSTLALNDSLATDDAILQSTSLLIFMSDCKGYLGKIRKAIK